MFDLPTLEIFLICSYYFSFRSFVLTKFTFIKRCIISFGSYNCIALTKLIRSISTSTELKYELFVLYIFHD